MSHCPNLLLASFPDRQPRPSQLQRHFQLCAELHQLPPGDRRRPAALGAGVPGAPVAHRVVPGHAEAAGDDLDAQVPGKAALATLVQHCQGHEQNAGEIPNLVI